MILNCLKIIFLFVSSAMCLGKDVAIISDCQFYSKAEQLGDLVEAKDLLENIESSGAIKVCEANGDRVFYVASEIKEDKGVAYFYLNRVFKVDTGKGVRWDYLPPTDKLHLADSQVYMLIKGSTKVTHSDAGFVQVRDMSAGLFKLIMLSWESYLSSEDKLDEFLSGLSFFEKRSGNVKSFKKALGGLDKPSVITTCMKKGKNKSPHYSFSAANHNSMWIFDFDVSKEGSLKLINLQMIAE